MAVLCLGCGVGLAMNYFSWALREAVSATTVTVIGNICKFITILANLLIWDQHSGDSSISYAAFDRSSHTATTLAAAMPCPLLPWGCARCLPQLWLLPTRRKILQRFSFNSNISMLILK